MRHWWEGLKEVWGDMLVIALGIILEIHFVLFKVKGWVLIGEDNPWILNLEIALAAGIILFGVERWWDNYKRWKGKQR